MFQLLEYDLSLTTKFESGPFDWGVKEGGVVLYYHYGAISRKWYKIQVIFRLITNSYKEVLWLLIRPTF